MVVTVTISYRASLSIVWNVYRPKLPIFPTFLEVYFLSFFIIRACMFQSEYSKDAVADPGFPRWGAPTPEFGAKTYYLARFLLKTT